MQNNERKGFGKPRSKPSNQTVSPTALVNNPTMPFIGPDLIKT